MVSLIRDIIKTILIIEEEEEVEMVNETLTLIILLEVQMEAKDSADGVVDNTHTQLFFVCICIHMLLQYYYIERKQH